MAFDFILFLIYLSFYLDFFLLSCFCLIIDFTFFLDLVLFIFPKFPSQFIFSFANYQIFLSLFNFSSLKKIQNIKWNTYGVLIFFRFCLFFNYNSILCILMHVIFPSLFLPFLPSFSLFFSILPLFFYSEFFISHFLFFTFFSHFLLCNHIRYESSAHWSFPIFFLIIPHFHQPNLFASPVINFLNTSFTYNNERDTLISSEQENGTRA